MRVPVCKCGIMLTKKGTKGSHHPKKSLGMSFKKPGELLLKTTEEMTESWSKRVQAVEELRCSDQIFQDFQVS